MHEHLWEVEPELGFDGSVYERDFDSWHDFIRARGWELKRIQDSIPVFWNWQPAEAWAHPDDDGDDVLNLIWIHPAPCHTCHVQIVVDKEEEEEIREWLIEHGFLKRVDDV